MTAVNSLVEGISTIQIDSENKNNINLPGVLFMSKSTSFLVTLAPISTHDCGVGERNRG